MKKKNVLLRHNKWYSQARLDIYLLPKNINNYFVLNTENILEKMWLSLTFTNWLWSKCYSAFFFCQILNITKRCNCIMYSDCKHATIYKDVRNAIQIWVNWYSNNVLTQLLFHITYSTTCSYTTMRIVYKFSYQIYEV